MKILIDIGHPAHVHYYRNFISLMQREGHQFLVIARDRGVIFDLLKRYNIDFISRGSGSKKLVGKLFYSIYSIGFILLKALKFKPDVFLSQGGLYTAPVAWMMKKGSISTEDTENASVSHKIAKRFKSTILSPSCFTKQISDKHLKFNSYQELFYLHPSYFQPSESVYEDLNLTSKDKFAIIRFVDWNAHHDVGHQGLSLENKIRAVKEISKYVRVFILSESELPNELTKFKIKIPSDKMHDALHYAELLFGESSTMASECACLGTPAIFIDNEGRGYTDEQEAKYSLVHNFTESSEDQDSAIQRAIDLLADPNLADNSKESRKQLLADKISPTEFLTWFIKEYPSSMESMRNDPNFQLKFK